MNPPGEPKVSVQQLLHTLVEKGASDLHITSGAPPMLRIDGAMVPLKLPPLGAAETKALCFSVLTEEQRAHFERANELDLSFGIKGLSRFRANIFMQRGAVAGAFRTIPFRVATFDELGVPPVVAEFANKPNGLVLITGPTGSGKSTTLAALIDKINASRRLHILTIEDPIEFIHQHKLSIVNQREVGSDTEGFKHALRYVLRQDPDVVLIGEMRDLETIEAALTISETGHLVFGTLHTNGAVSTINRIIDAFPPHHQAQVRTKLALVLQGVVSQQLIPRMGVPGRVLGVEVMIPNAAIRNLIRDDKVHQLYSQLQIGQEKHGMQTLNQSLYSLYAHGVIALEEAIMRASELEEFKMMVEGRTSVLPQSRSPHSRPPSTR
jgi:twitching motility protein PilT